MYIAMNRFKIVLGREMDFEAIWKNRDTFLTSVPGFKEFHLVRGSKTEEYTLYASHSTWASESDFSAWTKSQAFRQAELRCLRGRMRWSNPCRLSRRHE